MENRRFLRCKPFIHKVSPLTIEVPDPQDAKSFSPVSELTLDLGGLTTRYKEVSPNGTPKRCIRVIQSQKTTITPKSHLFYPQAQRVPFTGDLLDFVDSPAKFAIKNSSRLANEKSPHEMQKRSAFRRVQELSPVLSVGNSTSAVDKNVPGKVSTLWDSEASTSAVDKNAPGKNLTLQDSEASTSAVDKNGSSNILTLLDSEASTSAVDKNAPGNNVASVWEQSIAVMESGAPAIFSPQGCSRSILSPLADINTPSPCISTLPKLALDMDTSPTPPPATKCSKPSTDDDDETSQDSGVNMDSEFKFPEKPVTRPGSLITNDLCFSPGTLMCSPSTPTSPQSLSFSSPCPDLLQVDDGFHDDLEIKDAPAGISQLINGQLLSRKSCKLPSVLIPEFTPNRSALPRHMEGNRTAKRGLFRSPSAPRLLTSLHRQSSMESTCSNASDVSDLVRNTKRTGRDDDVYVRPVVKRRKSVLCVTQEDSQEDQENVPPVRKTNPRILQRCQSEQIIKSALKRADEDGSAGSGSKLIGDFSQRHCLPLCASKHSDLKGISPQTLSELLNGKYDDDVNKYLIVDCRYPYEYDGGHIKGAENIYTKFDIFKKFMGEEEEFRKEKDSGKRNILIFHCEFSSERGPKMSRFLRNKDRDANKDAYPHLHYPEVYLLEGGYKEFYQAYPKECTSDGGFIPMLDSDHYEDLKKFRTKTKTWNSEKCNGPSLGRRTGLKERFG